MTLSGLLVYCLIYAISPFLRQNGERHSNSASRTVEWNANHAFLSNIHVEGKVHRHNNVSIRKRHSHLPAFVWSTINYCGNKFRSGNSQWTCIHVFIDQRTV